MKYILDTNICIHLFRGKYNLIEKFEEINLDDCAISEITLAELIFGAENSPNPKKTIRLLTRFPNKLKSYRFLIQSKFTRRKKSD